MITAVPSGGAQDEAYVAITSCSGARVPKFDSKLEIQSPEQGGMILLFLTACAGQLAQISSVLSNLGNQADGEE